MAPSTVLSNAQLAQQNLDYYLGVFTLHERYILNGSIDDPFECTARTAKSRLLFWSVHTTIFVHPKMAPSWIPHGVHSLHGKM